MSARDPDKGLSRVVRVCVIVALVSVVGAGFVIHPAVGLLAIAVCALLLGKAAVEVRKELRDKEDSDA